MGQDRFDRYRDHGRRGGHNEHHGNHHRKHRERPCGYPPAIPTGVVLTFKVHEARTHLRFTGKVKWNEVTLDEQGHGTVISRYDVQLRATDVAGVPIDTEDGKTRIRMHVKAVPRRLSLASAVTTSGNFVFTTMQANNIAVGESVEVRGCKKPATYNGTYTVASVAGKSFTVPGTSGTADCEDPGVVIDDDDKLHVITRELPRPKTWYWQARVRAVDKDECAGDWSAWTTPPGLPWTGANPKPPVPTNITLNYDVERKARHGKFRGIAQWDEVVNWDVPGGDREDDMKAYVCLLQRSDDGVTWTDTARDRERSAKDDDANTFVRAVFHNLRKRYFYRIKVRSIDRFNRRGDWSAWVPGGAPGDSTTIPGPATVSLDVDNHTYRIKWTQTEETGVDHITSLDVDYCQVELATDAGFTSVIESDYDVRGRHKMFRASKPGNGTYFARVRNISDTEKPSAWTTTSATKGTPTAPATPSITYDATGTRHAKYRALVTVVAVAATDRDIAKYHVQFAHKAANVTPTAGDKRQGGRIDGDATGDDLTEVFRNVPKGHYGFARARTVDTEGKASAWSAWSAGSRARDSAATDTPNAPTANAVAATVTATAPTPRRVKGIWDDPDDDSTVRWRVEVYKGVTLMETGRTRSNRFIYHVPSADTGAIHSLKVYAVSDTLTESTAATSNNVTPDPESGAPAVPGTPAVPTLAFDVSGTRHARFRAIATAGLSSTGGTVGHYVLQLAHAVDAGTSATPYAGAKRDHKNVEGDATGDDLTEVFRNIPRTHRVWLRERAVNAGGPSAWTAWVGNVLPSGSSTPGSPASVSVANPAPRRFVGTWPEPNDEESTRWSVVVKQAGVTKETGLTRNNRYTYRAPRSDARLAHTMEVTALNDLGVSSLSPTIGSSGGGGEDNDVETGTVALHGGSGTPTGWLRCNGAQVSTATYSDLFGAVGYTYCATGESGVSPTLFRVPDYRKRDPRGVGTGQAIGLNDEATNTTTDAARQDDHTGVVADAGTSDSNHLHGDGSLVVNSGTLILGNTVINIPTGGTRIAAGEMHGHNANSFGGSTGAKGSGHDHGATPQGKHGRIHQHFIIKT